MVPSKIHARLGVSAAAIVLGCAMSAILVRSGGGRLAPAVFVGNDEPAITSQQTLPPAETASRPEAFLSGRMLVATPMQDRLHR